MFAFFLAEKLSTTVESLRRSMMSDEFTAWMAFEDLRNMDPKARHKYLESIQTPQEKAATLKSKMKALFGG